MFQHACFKLAPGFIYFFFESFDGVGTKDKTLVRTENSSSAKDWLERLWIMFLLYWKVYVFFLNEDLHWFCRKRILTDGGVYMRLKGGVDSKVASSYPIWICILRYIGTGECCLYYAFLLLGW